jgi:hypothetical protein
MVDNSRIVDMSGDDVVVNTIRYSTTRGSQGFNVIDNQGGGVTTVSATSATLTYAVMQTGFIVTTAATAVTLTFDTAVNIIKDMAAAGAGPQIGDTIIFTVGCKGAGTATVALASGVTNPNTVSLAAATNAQRQFILTVTGVSTPALVVNA